MCWDVGEDERIFICRVCSIPQLCGSQKWNSVCPAQWQSLSPSKSSHQPSTNLWPLCLLSSLADLSISHYVSLHFLQTSDHQSGNTLSLYSGDLPKVQRRDSHGKSLPAPLYVPPQIQDSENSVPPTPPAAERTVPYPPWYNPLAWTTFSPRPVCPQASCAVIQGPRWKSESSRFGME